MTLCYSSFIEKKIHVLVQKLHFWPILDPLGLKTQQWDFCQKIWLRHRWHPNFIKKNRSFLLAVLEKTSGQMCKWANRFNAEIYNTFKQDLDQIVDNTGRGIQIQSRCCQWYKQVEKSDTLLKNLGKKHRIQSQIWKVIVSDKWNEKDIKKTSKENIVKVSTEHSYN